MKSVLLICVFLLPLQTLALPVRNRLRVPRTQWRLPETESSVTMETITIPSKASSAGARERGAVWRALMNKGQSSRPTSSPNNIPQGHQRERRHVHKPSRGQLMRVGCMLGTCQVQNLGHRLYQMGQSGRQDSPINPKSPHSYG